MSGSKKIVSCVKRLFCFQISLIAQEPRCVLCPRDNSALVKAVRKKPPVSDFDMLSAMKPTEGCQWAHVLCSAWIPEVVYTKPATLKAAEGISTILHDRWQEVSVVRTAEVTWLTS